MTSAVTKGDGVRKWHEHITIDLFAGVLAKSIFHPFVAWLIPLCLRAVDAPVDSTEFLSACAYASVVTAFWILSVFDRRIAYGVPRTLDWNEEVVVITGGANGLGKVIAETYGMRGASVAVLDVAKPTTTNDNDLNGVHYYQCDVGDAEAVNNVAETIEQELGVPTILINNAGMVNGKVSWDLTAEDVDRNMKVNVISHFNTIRTFLPGMLSSSKTGGTIVTVASVLGKMGASHLSDYCAAKAALIAMHKSLSSELTSADAPDGAEDVRMVLVTPGQLSTRLFADLETPSNFFGPVVEHVELAREIVRTIDSGWSAEISMPLYARFIEWNLVMPAGLQRILRAVSGIDQAMSKANARKNGKKIK